MSLRPTRARWFETWVPRDHTVRATEVLAATGVVQLELEPRHDSDVDVERLRHFVERFESLAAAYEEDLPPGIAQPTALIGDAVHIANQAVHTLRQWSARLDFTREHLAQLRAEHDQLVLLTECLEGMHPAGWMSRACSARPAFSANACSPVRVGVKNASISMPTCSASSNG